MYTKEALARLGKQASDMYLKEDIPLNDAIVKLASARPDLTKEHVQRVIENANLVTFEELFKGSSDKHVVFDLADPEDIHGQLHTESDSHASHVYGAPPEIKQDNPFDHLVTEKVSSYSHVPKSVQNRREYYATRSAVDTLVKQASYQDRAVEGKMNRFIQMCKRASIEHGIRPVLQVAGYASEDKEIFSKVAHTVTKAMPWDIRQGEYTESAPNPQHPVYQSYKDLESNIKIATKLRAGLLNAEVRHRSATMEDL